MWILSDLGHGGWGWGDWRVRGRRRAPGRQECGEMVAKMDPWAWSMRESTNAPTVLAKTKTSIQWCHVLNPESACMDGTHEAKQS